MVAMRPPIIIVSESTGLFVPINSGSVGATDRSIFALQAVSSFCMWPLQVDSRASLAILGTEPDESSDPRVWSDLQ